MGEFLKDTDKLFRDDFPDARNTAIMNYHFKQFAFYTDGYRIAADNLLNECLRESAFSRGDIDVLVYPIAFNYRHYVELRLKEIVLGLRHLNGDDNHGFKDHDIKKLWNEIKVIGEDLRQNGDDLDFENAERIILELHDIDDRSFSFRFPTDKKGDKLLLQISKLDLRNFGVVMERLANFLDALSDVVDHYKNV